MIVLEIMKRRIVSIFWIVCISIFLGYYAYLENSYSYAKNEHSNSNGSQNFTFPYRFLKNAKLSKTLWPNDDSCKEYKVHLSKNIRPTYLVSYPRSGNTWVRYLVESSSGIFTGSVYNDKNEYKLGYLGELQKLSSHTTILIKSHASAFRRMRFSTRKAKVMDYLPVILIIRNPFKSIQSYYEYTVAKRQRKNPFKFQAQSTDTFTTSKFHRFVRPKFNYWATVNLDRLVLSKKLLVICYEMLIEDPIAYVRKMLNFLKVPIDEQRLACLKKHLEGPAKKKQKEVDSYSIIEKQEGAYYMSMVVTLLKARGFPVPQQYMEIIHKYTAF